MKTDQRLQQDVVDELTWEPSVRSKNIGVEVKKGIVTLIGEVNSYTEKLDIETTAQRVAGVKGLAIDIAVKLQGEHQRSDSEIAESVERVLSWSTYLEQDKIDIMVENGVVTISGQVHWDYERRSAMTVLRHLKGVVGIIDHITIKEKIASSTVKADIEAALKRRAINDAHSVKVTVQGSDVVLSGTVHSLSERDLVTSTAWSSKDVWSVIDHIEIVA